MRPTTPSSFAILRVYSLMVSRCLSGIVTGGITQAESPEWTPACSICSITAGTKVSAPSERASASASRAFSRNRSMRIGSLRGHVDGGRDVPLQHLLVVDHLHPPAAEDVGRSDHQRVADSGRHLQGFIEVARHPRLGHGDLHLLHHHPEPVPVLGEVDGVDRRPYDPSPRLLQLPRDV